MFKTVFCVTEQHTEDRRDDTCSWERKQDARDAQREASRTCEAAREARRAAKSRPHDTILRDLAAIAERRARLADERAMGGIEE